MSSRRSAYTCACHSEQMPSGLSYPLVHQAFIGDLANWHNAPQHSRECSPDVAIIFAVQDKAKDRFARLHVITSRCTDGEAGLPPGLERERGHSCICAYPSLEQHILVYLCSSRAIVKNPEGHLLPKTCTQPLPLSTAFLRLSLGAQL